MTIRAARSTHPPPYDMVPFPTLNTSVTGKRSHQHLNHHRDVTEDHSAYGSNTVSIATNSLDLNADPSPTVSCFLREGTHSVLSDKVTAKAAKHYGRSLAGVDRFGFSCEIPKR